MIRAYLEHSKGVRVETETTDDPTWNRTADLIKSLNGKDISLLTLKGETGELTIGGGENQRYVVFASYGEEQMFTLYSTQYASDNSLLQMVAGGQIGEYEQQQCCTLAEVLSVAKVFAETGEMEPSMNWVEE